MKQIILSFYLKKKEVFKKEVLLRAPKIIFSQNLTLFEIWKYAQLFSLKTFKTQFFKILFFNLYFQFNLSSEGWIFFFKSHNED